jgi:hypothetical protein
MRSKSYLVVAAVLVASATITLTPTATVGVDAVLSPVARLPPWKPYNHERARLFTEDAVI